MKRILVIDESEVIRETLALILGQEFDVVVRSPEETGHSLADRHEGCDLLILGVSPGLESQSFELMKFASELPYPILFIVDSKIAARAIEERKSIAWLSKPFNPYELKAQVKKLLARLPVTFHSAEPLSQERRTELSQYLEFPYLTPSAAGLARRFAISRLPILITGEMGCGLGRMARAIHALDGQTRRWISLHAAEMSDESIAQRRSQITSTQVGPDSSISLILEELERLLPSGQAALVKFLEEIDGVAGKIRLLATAREDLLEKVYRGDFLESLYYRLATLTLRIPPLRDRRSDLPAIARWFARRYGERLGLGEIHLTPGAYDRLGKYLWFGNLDELEAVIARTLAAHRKTQIDAVDLSWDFSVESRATLSAEPSEVVSVGAQQPKPSQPTNGPIAGNEDGQSPSGSTNGRSPELKLLIHELAHELKNPMVTIKTFAQLLGERYQDETFRARFQDIVDGDIEKIDDLLEVMIEFASFSQPKLGKLVLQNHVRTVLGEISSECAERQSRIRWGEEGALREVMADEAQFSYALKNVLLAVIAQAKFGSEIGIDIGPGGSLNISYLREGGRINPITQYFDLSSSKADEGVLPLRILLAKQLVERNGGAMIINHLEGERDILKMELPIV